MVTDIDPVQLKVWTDGNWEERRYQYQLYHNDLLIDLGAFEGAWAERMHDLYDTDIICVEPTSAIMRLNGCHWANIINKAAWIENGTRLFGGSGYWTTHQLEHNQQYPCFDILTILNQPIGLMKINIEGDEYEVMARILESGKQTEIRNFQIQFHQVPYHEKYYKLIALKLAETHDLAWRVPYVWESWTLKC